MQHVFAPKFSPLLFLSTWLFLAAGLQPALSQQTETAAAQRPGEWAQPLQRNGLPNLFKVTSALYRGAQPAPEGFKQLQDLGIKTVLNLRAFHSDEHELKDTQLAYERIPIETWHPKVEQVVSFLKIVTDKQRTPVFVHCQHGADRTGTMIAVYRIAVQGWSKDQAIKEMVAGGYGYHSVWQNLINFIQELDIAAIKREAGLVSSPNPGPLCASPPC